MNIAQHNDNLQKIYWEFVENKTKKIKDTIYPHISLDSVLTGTGKNKNTNKRQKLKKHG